jgi:hypothetical protein
MSVVTSYGYCSAGGAATEIVGSSASYLALTVVILSFISLIVRVVYLTSRFRFLFVVRSFYHILTCRNVSVIKFHFSKLSKHTLIFGSYARSSKMYSSSLVTQCIWIRVPIWKILILQLHSSLV